MGARDLPVTFFFLAQHRLRSYAEFICKKNTLSNASIAKSRE